MPLGELAVQPWPSNQRRPSLLWRLLQNLKQQVAEGFGDAAVARRRQVEEVEHVLRDDGSVGVDEALADVQELSLLPQPRQPGAHQPIDRSILLPQWVGTLASRQQTLKNNIKIFLISKVLKSSTMIVWIQRRNRFYSSYHTYAHFCCFFRYLCGSITHQDDDLSLWEARLQQFGDGKNSPCHLFRRVLIIVCSYPQHHHLDKTTDTLVTAPQ